VDMLNFFFWENAQLCFDFRQLQICNAIQSHIYEYLIYLLQVHFTMLVISRSECLELLESLTGSQAQNHRHSVLFPSQHSAFFCLWVRPCNSPHPHVWTLTLRFLLHTNAGTLSPSGASQLHLGNVAPIPARGRSRFVQASP
jgi:hypothetical protein